MQQLLLLLQANQQKRNPTQSNLATQEKMFQTFCLIDTICSRALLIFPVKQADPCSLYAKVKGAITKDASLSDLLYIKPLIEQTMNKHADMLLRQRANGYQPITKDLVLVWVCKEVLERIARFNHDYRNHQTRSKDFHEG